MTVTSTIDIGQIISGLLLFMLTILSWLIKNKIGNFETRLDRVEERSYQLSNDIQKLVGIHEGWNGTERRNHKID